MKVIGVDLGGTNIRVGLVENNEIIEEIKQPTNAELGSKAVIDKIIEMIKSLDNYQEAKAIGVSVPGILDSKNGIVIFAINLGWQGVELAKPISKALGIDTFIAGDAKMAALAEATLGAGSGHDIVQYITLSTGVGGGLVINGTVLDGAFSQAGEISNLIVSDNGPKIDLLNKGALELMASGTSILHQGKTLINENIQTTKEVFNLYTDNNEIAIKIVDSFVTSVARAMSYITHIVNPSIFVLGGGVMNSSDIFLDKLNEEYKSLVFPTMHNTEISIASLNEPGIIGAALYAISKK